ncbi:hypothetical protein [Kitasatospora sp. NPDC088346]|uniref:hypothetical protein n=1 Tax=Kitasatospora sp. NPDC088346 TaxID=3364073 RepID=UPI0038120790
MSRRTLGRAAAVLALLLVGVGGRDAAAEPPQYLLRGGLCARLPLGGPASLLGPVGTSEDRPVTDASGVLTQLCRVEFRAGPGYPFRGGGVSVAVSYHLDAPTAHARFAFLGRASVMTGAPAPPRVGGLGAEAYRLGGTRVPGRLTSVLAVRDGNLLLDLDLRAGPGAAGTQALLDRGALEFAKAVLVGLRD